jgi:hypothetical protein
MTKYTWIGRKIRHAHKPVGRPRSAGILDFKCVMCGYNDCACHADKVAVIPPCHEEPLDIAVQKADR